MATRSSIHNVQTAEHEERAEDLLDEGHYEAAIAAADAGLALGSDSVSLWLVRGSACEALGRLSEAANAFESVLARVPSLADVHVNIANVYAGLNRLSEAKTHLLEAIALEPKLAAAHANLGSVYMRMGRYHLAEAPSRQALALDPDIVAAYQNLAAILEHGHAAEAQLHRDLAYGRQQIFLESSPNCAHTALILVGANSGNVPYQYLLPRERYSHLLWYIEYAHPGQERKLPPYDFVFNAVADPDAAALAQAAAERFAAHCQVPLINRPDRIARTFRSMLPSLIGSIADVTVPKTIRLTHVDGNLQKAIRTAGIVVPLILRPAGRHGGDGARRVDSSAELAAQVQDDKTLYATEFVDYRSTDGWYRKYRVIFVDRKPYPYHLAISSHWLVHYWTAGMESDAARRAEEQEFLRNPEAALGQRALAALRAIATALDLDYAGIDFSLLPDGRLLFFEANATMLVHPENDLLFSYKNEAVSTIVTAVDAMIARRLEK